MAARMRTVTASFSKVKNEAFVFAFLLLKFVKYYISPDSPPVLTLRLLALLAFIALSAVLCGALIRKSGEAQRTAVSVLLALLLASPASNDVLMLDLWFKDNDVFANLIALACAVAPFFLLNKPKGKWLLPLLCFAGASLMPLFVLTLLPIPLVLVVDGIEQSAQAKQKNDYEDLLASTLIASAIGFLLFGAKRAFPGAGDFTAQLADGSKQALMRVAMVVPLFIVLSVLAVLARRAGTARPGGKTAVLLALLPLMSLADPFAQAGTGPSTVMAAAFAQGCLLVYFLYRGSPPFCGAAARLESFFRGNPLLLWLLLIWLAAFSGLGKIMLLGLTKSKSFFHIWQ